MLTHDLRNDPEDPATADIIDTLRVAHYNTFIIRMAFLITYDPKNITAVYSPTAKQFSVTATVPLPLPVVTAEFKRQEGFTGGRKFRLEGFAGGLAGQQPLVMKPYVETNMAEPPRFSAVFVTLKDPATKTEITASIPITIDASTAGAAPVPFRPQAMPALPLKCDPSALKAIDISLPAQNFVRITAPVPDAAAPRPLIEGRNEGDATYTWRAGQLPGLVYWDVAWAGNGAGVGKGATFIVTTTAAKTSSTSAASTQVTVQPYAIKLPAAKNGTMVDLFDPDA